MRASKEILVPVPQAKSHLIYDADDNQRTEVISSLALLQDPVPIESAGSA